mmetsp:Transcript_515/g.616  ORF Transcript_515/g.616 Transcript_515/m.616 type:complete len:98 (+) Transcript_515:858-1151(+)
MKDYTWTHIFVLLITLPHMSAEQLILRDDSKVSRRKKIITSFKSDFIRPVFPSPLFLPSQKLPSNTSTSSVLPPSLLLPKKAPNQQLILLEPCALYS